MADSSLILDKLEGFTVVKSSTGAKKGSSEPLFRKAIGTSGYHDCISVLKTDKTMELNRANIAYNAAKFLRVNEIVGKFEIVLAKRMEDQPIPEGAAEGTVAVSLEKSYVFIKYDAPVVIAPVKTPEQIAAEEAEAKAKAEAEATK